MPKVISEYFINYKPWEYVTGMLISFNLIELPVMKLESEVEVLEGVLIS